MFSYNCPFCAGTLKFLDGWENDSSGNTSARNIYACRSCGEKFTHSTYETFNAETCEDKWAHELPNGSFIEITPPEIHGK